MLREIELPFTMVGDGDGLVRDVPLKIYDLDFRGWFIWLLGALRRYSKNLAMVAKAHRMAEAAHDASERFRIDADEWVAICAELSKDEGPECGFAPMGFRNGQAVPLPALDFYPFLESLQKATHVEC